MSDNDKIDQHILDKFTITKKLGAGAYGIVWKAHPKDHPQSTCAIKKAFQAFQHSTDAQRTFRQISVLKKISHPNIVKMHEVLPSVSGRDVYLVFEYVNTDVYHMIYEGKLQDVHKKYITYQMLLGLYYLHSAKLIHRDLKPSNLLLSQECQLKICDFGLIRSIGQQSDEAVLTQGVATRWYRAPEILLGSQSYDQKADLWSVGCILAQMYLKSPLFNCNSIISQTQKILQIVGRPSAQDISLINSQVSSAVLDQIGAVRQKNPKQIFGAMDPTFIDILFKMLCFNREKRVSAQQALRHPYFRQFFKEQDLITCKHTVNLQIDDNTKLSAQAYRETIYQHFIQKKQPQRFGDLRRKDRDQSVGKPSIQSASRRASSEKSPKCVKNTHIFRQLLKQRQQSIKKRANSSQSTKNPSRPKDPIQDKQNISANPQKSHLQRFNNISKPAGTFAALRKTTTTKFAK